MNKRTKTIILDDQKKDMFQVGNTFIKDFNNRMSNERQIDDVLLIGIEF